MGVRLQGGDALPAHPYFLHVGENGRGGVIANVLDASADVAISDMARMGWVTASQEQRPNGIVELVLEPEAAR